MLSNSLKALVVFTLIELLAFRQSAQKLISFLIFWLFFIKKKEQIIQLASVKQRKCEISLIILRQNAFLHASELPHNFFGAGKNKF